MDRPIILMETQTKAIEPVPGGMWQKRAAELLGAGVGAVNHWVRTYREGGMAALVVPERLRTLDHGRPWRDDQFAACRVSSSRDMSR